MEKLKDIQQRGPRNPTKEEEDIWHTQILEAAYWEIRGEAPTGEKIVEEVGSYDPWTQKYVPTHRKVEIEEPETEDSFRDKYPSLNEGQELPPEAQPDTWDPRNRIWKKAGGGK